LPHDNYLVLHIKARDSPEDSCPSEMCNRKDVSKIDESMIKKLGPRIPTKKTLLTLGRQGTIEYGNKRFF
jgi:hypothetical protein